MVIGTPNGGIRIGTQSGLIGTGSRNHGMKNSIDSGFVVGIRYFD